LSNSIYKNKTFYKLLKWPFVIIQYIKVKPGQNEVRALVCKLLLHLGKGMPIGHTCTSVMGMLPVSVINSFIYQGQIYDSVSGNLQ